MIGKYTEHIAVKNNVIEIKFAYDAHASIFDQKIKLTVTNKDGSISWTCTSDGKIKLKHLPVACR